MKAQRLVNGRTRRMIAALNLNLIVLSKLRIKIIQCVCLALGQKLGQQLTLTDPGPKHQECAAEARLDTSVHHDRLRVSDLMGELRFSKLK